MRKSGVSSLGVFWIVWASSSFAMEPKVSPILHTEEIQLISEDEARRREEERQSVLGSLEKLGYERNAWGNMALLSDELPGADPGLVNDIRSLAKGMGWTVTEMGAEDLANSALLTSERFDMLVLTSAASVPQRCAPAIQSFLSQGGDLLALDAPAFARRLYRTAKGYVPEEEVRKALSKVSPGRTMIAFREADLTAWKRTTNDEKSPFQVNLVEGPFGSRDMALHVKISQLTGWEGLLSPELTVPFSPESSLTLFSAKGGPRTHGLTVEWEEMDGSRWIASVPLEESWTRVTLAPEDFKYWKDCLAKDRGWPGDVFHPENGRKFCVGLAMSHTQVSTGPHEFWVGDVRCGQDPFQDRVSQQMAVVPVEALCPEYKFYPCREVSVLTASESQCVVGAFQREGKGLEIFASHPRPQGTGIQKSRRARWIPIVEALSPEGDLRGAPGAAWLGLQDPWRKSILASFSIRGQSFYREAETQVLLGRLLRRMGEGIFLAEGGSQFYAYFWECREINLGATVVHYGRGSSREVSVRISLFRKGDATPLMEKEFPLSLSPGEERSCQTIFPREEGLDPQGYEVITELFCAGERVDSLKHEVVVWAPPASKTKPMTVADGEFWQEGSPWYPHGVNYMPSSGMALEDGEAFEYWMDSRAYDPEVIERDLARIEKLKMNMVSVFIYHRSLKSMNLLDLLVRCQRHGLKVNLSLRPGTPMDFRWEEMKEIIETYRLKMQESLFAYDLAWEPVHGTHEARKRWDPEWVAWLKARYGSVEDAEARWGVEMPKENDQWTNPSDVQVSTEGAWRPMVASYRQFLNELLLEKYGQARSLVQSVDPQHLVSFRMNVAGDPTVNPAQGMAYEFEGLSGAVDFLAPEGYGRIGEWDRVKDGCFTVALARLANPDLPVIWAEFGMSTWDDAQHESSPKRLEEAGRFYRDFYEMILLSGANGSVCWFYPGGFRVGENSDFGILNPDGTLRPVSQAILSYASRIQGRRQVPKSAEVVEVTPEDHVSGIYGMYEAVKPLFWSKTTRTIPRLVKTTRPLAP